MTQRVGRAMEREQFVLREVILKRLSEMSGLHAMKLSEAFLFADWIVEHFRPVPCPMQLARMDGRHEHCTLGEFHEGDHVFPSSIRYEEPST